VADIPRLDGITVLIVDDHEDTVDMLAEALRLCGAAVLTAANARSALDAFYTTPCDVVATDFAMADHDGGWLLQQIRASTRPRTPVVVVTGRVRAGTPADIEAAGFDGFVVKPVDPFELCRLILKILSKA